MESLTASELHVFSQALIDSLEREIKIEIKAVGGPFEKYYAKQRQVAQKRRERFQKFHDAVMDEIGRRLGFDKDENSSTSDE